MKMWPRMSLRGVGALLLTAALSLGAASGAEFGKVFQSHSPDGAAYLVVLCLQADECLEYAYQFCEGPYTPLDKSFVPSGGFRFVCRSKPHKRNTPDSSTGPPAPSTEKPQG